MVAPLDDGERSAGVPDVVPTHEVLGMSSVDFIWGCLECQVADACVGPVVVVVEPELVGVVVVSFGWGVH